MAIQDVPKEATRGRLERAIGSRVRQRREQLGLSNKELAGIAHISPPMLSRIERGMISPSMGTLEALSEALRLPMAGFFLDYDATSKATLTKAGNGVLEVPFGMLLAIGGQGRNMIEPYLFSVHSTRDFVHPPRVKGTAFLYVVEGSLKYAHQDTIYDLELGDSLFFDASSEHGTAEICSVPTRFLYTLLRPKI